MTLSFQQNFKDGKPTGFVARIWASLFELNEEFYYEPQPLFLDCQEKQLFSGSKVFVSTPKIHTIRSDKKDRWKAGNKIHFVINNRTKDRFQFAPVILCKSTQRIQIMPFSMINKGIYYQVTIDGKRLSSDEIKDLAKNDGFKNVAAFWKYFNKPFAGKIIHWTDFNY